MTAACSRTFASEEISNDGQIQARPLHTVRLMIRTRAYSFCFVGKLRYDRLAA